MNSLPLKPEVCDADADYWLSETKPLTMQQKHAVTEWIPVQPKPLIERETKIALIFCTLAGIALLGIYYEVPFRVGQFIGSHF